MERQGVRVLGVRWIHHEMPGDVPPWGDARIQLVHGDGWLRAAARVGHVEGLIERGIEILNRYSTLFQAKTFSTQAVGMIDYLYVLEAVSNELRRREDAYWAEVIEIEGRTKD